MGLAQDLSTLSIDQGEREKNGNAFGLRGTTPKKKNMQVDYKVAPNVHRVINFTAVMLGYFIALGCRKKNDFSVSFRKWSWPWSHGNHKRKKVPRPSCPFDDMPTFANDGERSRCRKIHTHLDTLFGQVPGSALGQIGRGQARAEGFDSSVDRHHPASALGRNVQVVRDGAGSHLQDRVWSCFIQQNPTEGWQEGPRRATAGQNKIKLNVISARLDKALPIGNIYRIPAHKKLSHLIVSA